jgi:hypothetical protein
VAAAVAEAGRTVIAKITRGSDPSGLARYLYGPGRVRGGREDHVDPRVVASGSVMRDDSRGWRPWVADMSWCIEQRPKVANPIWHCSLRAAPGDRSLSDAEWGAIAEQHVAAMGLDEHPWVAVRHGDDHVHVVACRVDGEGKLWRDSHDKFRVMRSCRAIEQRHGLTVWTEQRASGPLAMTSVRERDKAAGRGVEPERVRLRAAMHRALDQAHGRGVRAWEDALSEQAVLWRRATTKDRRVTGYSVSLSGWVDAAGGQVWVKASKVDRRLSWNLVRPAIGADRPGADRAPRSAAELAAQAFPKQAVPSRPAAGGRQTGATPATRYQPRPRADRGR